MDEHLKIFMSQVADDAAQKAVSDFLVRLGVDVDSPVEIQKDMAALRELRLIVADPDIQKDLLHLRTWRVAMERVKTKGILTLFAILCTFFVAAFWMGFKDLIAKAV